MLPQTEWQRRRSIYQLNRGFQFNRNTALAKNDKSPVNAKSSIAAARTVDRNPASSTSAVAWQPVRG